MRLLLLVFLGLGSNSFSNIWLGWEQPSSGTRGYIERKVNYFEDSHKAFLSEAQRNTVAEKRLETNGDKNKESELMNAWMSRSRTRLEAEAEEIWKQQAVNAAKKLDEDIKKPTLSQALEAGLYTQRVSAASRPPC